MIIDVGTSSIVIHLYTYYVTARTGIVDEWSFYGGLKTKVQDRFFIHKTDCSIVNISLFQCTTVLYHTTANCYTVVVCVHCPDVSKKLRTKSYRLNIKFLWIIYLHTGNIYYICMYTDTQ